MLPSSYFDRGVTTVNGVKLNEFCDYTNEMSGTSSAAPNTTGAIALLLDANSALTWRDVKHILAKSARKVDGNRPAVTRTLKNNVTFIAEEPWITNAANFNFHNWYGFGAVDVEAALVEARTYVPGSLGVWKETGWFSRSVVQDVPILDFDAEGAKAQIAVSNFVPTVEAIVVWVKITHTNISDVGIELTSPRGTRSILLNIGNGLPSSGTGPQLQNFIATNAFYGEPAEGVWTLKVVDGYEGVQGTLNDWQINVYGH